MEVSVVAGGGSDCDPIYSASINVALLAAMETIYSILQILKGIPIAVMAIGKLYGINGIAFVACIIALHNDMKAQLADFKKEGSKL